MNTLSCAVVEDLLPLYAEELTSEETAAQMKEHIDRCPDCRDMLRRMKTEVRVDPKPQAPAKKVMRYIVGLRLWYLLCPLAALVMVFFGWTRAYAVYFGLMAVLAAVCIGSQYLSGASVGIDYEQVKLQQQAETRSRRNWGGYYASPLQIGLPALAVAAVWLGDKIIRFFMPYYSPLLILAPAALVGVAVLLCVVNRFWKK